ncbi:hypothetical protein FQZ97_941770 [compost metagenome]
MQQHQQRRARRWRGDAVQPPAAAFERGREGLGLQRIHTRVHLAVDLLGDLAGREPGSGLGQQAGDHLDAREQHLTQDAA